MRREGSSREAGARPRARRGIVLVVVLWTLAAVAVISASFTTANRDGALLARNLAERAKAEAVADSGVYRAVLALAEERRRGGPGAVAGADPRPGEASLAESVVGVATAGGATSPDGPAAVAPGTPWLADGTVYEWRFGGGTARIAVQDEAGLVDLNSAPGELLLALFRSAGMADDAAAATAARLLDFRDSDHETRPGGAEDADYRLEGASQRSLDRPLARVDELRLLPGLPARVYEAVAPLVTVHSGQPGVDPAVAPPGVLDVLAAAGGGPGPDDAMRATPRRRLAGERAGVRTPFATPSRRRAFEITSQGSTDGGGRFLRRAVVYLTGRPQAPFNIVVWDEVRGHAERRKPDDGPW